MTATEPPDLNARIYAVGMLCVQWSYVEHLIEATIWHLLRLSEDRGRIITDSLGSGMGARTGMLRKLCTAATIPDLETMNGILKRIEDTIADRNLFVHGMWHSDPSIGETWMTISRGKHAGGKKMKTAKEMGEVVNRGFGIIDDLEALLTKHGVIKVD